MTIRTNYWSCTKFSDKINKKIKELFPKNSKKLIAISEDILDKIQDILSFPYDKYEDITIFIHNVKAKSNVLYSPELKLGKYYDLDEKILFCCFHALVDFIEIELASLEIEYSEDKKLWKNGRSPELGVKHLKWEMSLVYNEENFGILPNDKSYGKPIPQAIIAKEKLELYNWWINIRPKRIDPFEGFNFYLEKNYCSIKYDIIHAMETNYKKEDKKMLKKLISIREYLWC